ncbi:conserved protein of unknown function [Rhodovastum atsumiense]|uniref:DUF177 domain-containing protein n=1 Tax=Rhodovastum atsumiense TaxID=504468 RepID=A0A5M6IJP2_9PROT|nr:DUF177 domain-containing protein [Rhodovastum atsumiense]KAA5608483.1 DUF177 domain-containing protein [Rhodovastum atsumiense]CAH2599303.1 conserved protein of unknown function [Rhodovastum atsumiense]
MTAPVELHRPVALDRIPATGLDVTIEASPAECEALAGRMAIPGVRSLACRFSLRPETAGVVVAEGQLRAEVVRSCVVSLEDFAMAVEERFRVRFVPAGHESEDDDPDADDEIPYEGGVLDIGEATAEQLALALDPYPRKPDAALPESAGNVPESPFAALARLQRRG